MLGSRLFWKVAVACAALALLSGGAILVLFVPRSEKEALEQIRQCLHARAALLREVARDALATREGVAAQAAVEELRLRIGPLSDETGTRYTVVRIDGSVVAESHEDPRHMERHDLRPEFREARATGREGVAQRVSRTTGISTLYLALPVRDGERLVGWVRASLPTTAVDARRREIFQRVAIGALIAAGLGLGLGLILTRKLTSRLALMARGARAITEGREPGRLPTRVKDETGDLARAIARLDEQLRHRMDALVQERNELTAVLASMLEGVVAVDGSERVVHMNTVAGELLQASPAESIGRRIWEITRVREVTEALEVVLRDNVEESLEVRFPGPPRGRSLELHASPLRDAQHGVAGAVLVLHDVTELRRLEVVRREFVANVSHELKTPLTAIRGLIETLIEDGEMGSATRLRFLERAHDQALRLSSLVTDLLALSRIESEEGAVERREMDLRDPIRECERRLDPTAAGRVIELSVSLPDAPVRVLGDEEAVRQIVDNLLDNAFKYTSDGGRVSLRLSAAGQDAVIEVQDTGIGIEPEHLDRIFERFYRIDKARSRELGGTGLGLSIVKHLVEALAGHVDVESEPGKGSTFRVSLPIFERADAGRSEA